MLDRTSSRKSASIVDRKTRSAKVDPNFLSKRLSALLLSTKYRNPRHVTLAERMLQTLIDKAIGGDIRAIKLIIYMVEGPPSGCTDSDLDPGVSISEITPSMTAREAQEAFVRERLNACPRYPYQARAAL
jgi:hypothetical protein